MKLEDAIRQMIKSYFEDDDFEGLESFKGKKYNKKYFDGIKSEFITKEETPTKGKKKNAYK